MKELKLHNSDQVAVVDDEDYERVKDYTWFICSAGYPVRSVGNSHVALHNEILNAKPGTVDHRNRVKWDNRKDNLRTISHGANLQNRGVLKNNQTGFKGVEFNSSTGKYVARISINRKRLNYGTFTTPEEAARAYDKAALKHYGPDALTNEKLGLLN